MSLYKQSQWEPFLLDSTTILFGQTPESRTETTPIDGNGDRFERDSIASHNDVVGAGTAVPAFRGYGRRVAACLAQAVYLGMTKYTRPLRNSL